MATLKKLQTSTRRDDGTFRLQARAPAKNSRALGLPLRLPEKKNASVVHTQYGARQSKESRVIFR